MEKRLSKVWEALSIVVMGSAALLFFIWDTPATNKPQAMVEQVPQPPDEVNPATVMLASVTLPPPPAPAPPVQVAPPIPPDPIKNSIKPLKPKSPPRETTIRIRSLKPPTPENKPALEHRLQATPPSPTSEKNGRALLRLLEIGKGPTIVIDWPNIMNERTRLYRLFTQCYGMKTALLTTDNKLYTLDTTPGKSWRPNLDKYSAFMRRPNGSLSHTELRMIQKLRNHHDLTTGAVVRFFPRHVDAVLLAGLRQLLSTDYDQNAVLKATYSLKGLRVAVSQITLNSQQKSGEIMLSPIQKCRLPDK